MQRKDQRMTATKQLSPPLLSMYHVTLAHCHAVQEWLNALDPADVLADKEHFHVTIEPISCQEAGTPRYEMIVTLGSDAITHQFHAMTYWKDALSDWLFCTRFNSLDSIENVLAEAIEHFQTAFAIIADDYAERESKIRSFLAGSSDFHETTRNRIVTLLSSDPVQDTIQKFVQLTWVSTEHRQGKWWVGLRNTLTGHLAIDDQSHERLTDFVKRLLTMNGLTLNAVAPTIDQWIDDHSEYPIYFFSMAYDQQQSVAANMDEFRETLCQIVTQSLYLAVMDTFIQNDAKNDTKRLSINDVDNSFYLVLFTKAIHVLDQLVNQDVIKRNA